MFFMHVKMLSRISCLEASLLRDGGEAAWPVVLWTSLFAHKCEY